MGVAAAAALSAFELEHSGGTVSLAQTPAKVVSFDLGVLDTLTVFGVPAAGVPKSTYEGLLASYKNATVVGTLFEPDYETLERIQPDLIFAGRRSEPAIPELSKVAPTAIFTSDPNDFLATFRKANLALGSAFGKEAQATAALASIDENVRKLHEINKGKTAALLFTIRDNVIPHAPGDRFGYAYEITGTTSVLPPKDPNKPAAPRPEPGSPEAEAAAKQREQLIREIAAAEPDWLIVLDRGAINGAERTAAATLAKHPVLGQTRALKENRVYYADPNGWYVIGGGLNNMQTITADLVATMQ